MRIAHFADCYRPVINGVVTSIAGLKEALEQRGHDVLLFTPSVPKYVEREKGLYRFASCPAPFQPEDRFSFFWPPATIKAVLNEKVDVVHIHTPFNMGLLGLWKARRSRVPVVFTHHTRWEEYTHYLRVGPKLGRKVANGVVGFFFRRSAAIVAPSEEVRDIVVQQGWKQPVVVIPTGIDAHLFEGGDAERVRQELSLSAETRLFLSVGRVAKEKSLDFLLQAFARAEGTDFVLAVVGGGPELENLRKLAGQLGLGDRTRFLGYRDRSDLKHYLAASRGFLFASQTETQGLVLLEAAAAGCPVIAVRASGVNEAVDDGRSALLHDPGDMQGFAESIGRLAHDDQLAASLAARSRIWAQDFSSSAMAQKMEAVYVNQIQASRD